MQMASGQKFGTVLILIVIIASSCSRQSGLLAQVESSQGRQFLNRNQISVVTSVQAIPKAVQSAWAKLANLKNFDMANPGEHFQETCDSGVFELPLHRLILAGSHNKYYFLYYECGGLVRHDCLVVFKVSAKGVLVVAGKQLLEKLTNLEFLISKLKTLEKGKSDNQYLPRMLPRTMCLIR